ncbi:accessory Sec system glycosylation chaperone GtfB [Leuconostoc gelidum subsp. aenigmaticum]|uniref:accessory Sec system glycosylation chaperone GtfB n=1 Tax=Leuconostoc gelidum TaxID=1244 RepID=UPI001CC6F407|nr:accessory Sec system glycosylation chaperone GtfB [Leuconostoc gelidum]MBZ6003528.1 accessory Sec system glycosylation chaperone GtfB [Leuconostoc gelidum subsp. aenigmaticum]
MISLFEYMDEKTTDLVWSLTHSEIKSQLVVIHDNGWLNDDVISPFSFYTKSYAKTDGHPLFFDEVPVNSFWGIRGNDQLAEVFDEDAIRANIFYHGYREVEHVEWRDRDGKIQFIDYYNRYGSLYARTYYHRDKPAQKSYFSTDKREIINHNLITDHIMLSWKNKNYFFTSLTQFVLFFIRENFDASVFNRMIYNSLSTPLFVVNGLEDKIHAVLIWDEPLQEDVPGNMVEILNNHNSNTKHVFFQRRSDMRKVYKNYHFERKNIISYLGKLYNFQTKVNQKNTKKTALIVTSSDAIWGLTTLVESLPQLNFKIMALTEMSSKLVSIGKYNNVELSPAASAQSVLEEIKHADYLLDINDGAEVLGAVKAAFLSHTLILSVSQFIHNTNYIAPENIFENHQQNMMISKIKLTDSNKFKYSESLSNQENIFGPTGKKYYYVKALTNF